MSFFNWKPAHRAIGDYTVRITEKAVERANAELMGATRSASTQAYYGDVYASNNLVRPTMEQVAEAARSVMRERAR